MPAYGKQLSPAEMEIMVDFLVGLRPEGQPPAGWATPVASLGEVEQASANGAARGGSGVKDQASGDGK
jgi:hypothetical protein